MVTIATKDYNSSVVLISRISTSSKAKVVLKSYGKSKTALKSSSINNNLVKMQYTNGENIKLTASLGNSYSIKELVPISSQTMSFPFIQADFIANTDTRGAGTEISFTDNSTGDPTMWAWTFGDGNTNTDQNPKHAYSGIGDYTISLTASNEFGSCTETKTDYISIGSIAKVERTAEGIMLDSQNEFVIGKDTLKTDFYRNLTYDAGLEGKYTFLVINPVNIPESEAPLWVYYHGGGSGYFDDQGAYQCLKWQNELTWNKEETYDSMIKNVLEQRLYKNGVLMDHTLSRRLKEGYRLLVVSYSDHDLYSGSDRQGWRLL